MISLAAALRSVARLSSSKVGSSQRPIIDTGEASSFFILRLISLADNRFDVCPCRELDSAPEKQ